MTLIDERSAVSKMNDIRMVRVERIAYCVSPIAYHVSRIAYCVSRIAYCVLRIAYCVLRIFPFAMAPLAESDEWSEICESQLQTAKAVMVRTLMSNR